MAWMRIILMLVLLVFSLYTGWVAWEFGYLSIFKVGFREYPTTQALFDLFVSVGLLMMIMIFDAKKRKLALRKVGPFVALTLFLGSIGPLMYFLIYPDLLKSTFTQRMRL